MAIGFLALTTVTCVNRLPEQDLRIVGAMPDAKLSVEARSRYFGKVVEITGSATRAGDDVPTDRYVLFAQSGDLGVRANLLDEQAAEILAKTKEDPRVTLKCYCEGINGNLILKSCVRP